MPDHIHFWGSIPPKISVSLFKRKECVNDVL